MRIDTDGSTYSPPTRLMPCLYLLGIFNAGDDNALCSSPAHRLGALAASHIFWAELRSFTQGRGALFMSGCLDLPG
jgi:hypothetical protein